MKPQFSFNMLRKLHSGKMGDFLVNFYATVTGVFISLICANWISGYNERKDVNQALTFVKEELSDNLETANAMYRQIRLEKTSMRYLERYAARLDSIPYDSLKYYGEAALKMKDMTFKFDAIESLKMSGLFSKMPDQKTAFTISKAYTAVRSLQHLYESYSDRKDELKNELQRVNEVRRLDGYVNADYWKIYLKYDEGRFYLNKLPLYQASKHYRNNVKTIKSAVELLNDIK